VYLAVAYLFQAGFIKRTPEGLIRITSHGQAALAIADRLSSPAPPSRPDVKAIAAITAPARKARPPTNEHHGSNRKRRPIWFLFFLTSVFTIGGLLSFWFGHDRVPVRPAFSDGGILVFVDGPPQGRGDINFVADTQGDFSVSVSAEGSPHFLVIASGSAVVEPTNPQNYNSYFEQGVFINSLTLNSNDPAHSTVTWQDHSKWGNHAFIADGEAYRINGYAGGPDVTAAIGAQYCHNCNQTHIPVSTVVYGKLRDPILSSAGSVEQGRLPLIGTATLLDEQGFGQDNPAKMSGGFIRIAGPIFSRHGGNIPPTVLGITPQTKWYATDLQENVNISIHSDSTVVHNPDPYDAYRPSLPPGVRLDSSAPPTVDSDELLWHEQGQKQVSWDMTNLSAAQHASLWVFWSGILFGLAASFAGLLLDRLLESKAEGAAATGGPIRRAVRRAARRFRPVHT
jgi:hypothetical protein